MTVTEPGDAAGDPTETKTNTKPDNENLSG